MVYGSETWVVWAEDIRVKRLLQKEMRMNRWMCSASLSERGVMRRSRLWLFSHLQKNLELRDEAVMMLMTT